MYVISFKEFFHSLSSRKSIVIKQDPVYYYNKINLLFWKWGGKALTIGLSLGDMLLLCPSMSSTPISTI